MADDHTKEVHLLSAIGGLILGLGALKLASVAPGLTERFPWLYVPKWQYFPPIGIVAALLGATGASLVAPLGKIRGTADMVGVGVGIAVCWMMLPQRPNLIVVFFVTIAYGFVGYVAGSMISGIKEIGGGVTAPETPP